MQETVQQQAWTIEQLYTAHYSHVLASVRSFGCSREEAEDITQDTFIKAMQTLPTIDSTRPAFPWLYQIAKNTAYDLLRRKRCAQRKGMMEMPEDAEYAVGNGSDLEEEVATRESVRCALRAISPRYRNALLLQGVGGYRYEDIAQLLGLTLGNTKTSLKRARAAFKQHYEEVPW